MELPPPTTIDDAEWILNLGTVFGALLDQLALNPATLKRLRNDEVTVVIHAQGIDLIAKVDLVGAATDDLITGLEGELRDAAGRD
ncbi:MAG: hypothetical protein IH943_06180 [Acidobacteria bacterium]|nr:hypothetical protein [Acidobacteriota bacterium]